MIYHGDCRDILPTLPASSVDSVVTDPPYELGFMGKRWDATGVAYDVAVWAETLRVLKPGGFLLAFGGTRTYHRLTCAVEDAGFQMRDSIAAWLYGSGFPKGKGQLKPAWEPIIVARRPAPAPVLQIDACRIGMSDTDREAAKVPQRSRHGYSALGDGVGRNGSRFEPATPGRWPPNVVFAHHATDWYTLRRDLPADIAESVRADYGPVEEVRVLPGVDLGDAIGPRQTPVLLAGVCERCEARRPGQTVGEHHLSAVREHVRDDAGVGSERAPEVLLSEVPTSSTAPPVSVGDTAHARGSAEDGQESVPARSLIAVEGRLVPQQGLPVRDGGHPAAGDADHPPLSGPSALRNGAPGRSGNHAGPTPKEGGGCPSRQRREDGQPAREPSGDPARRPLAGAPGDREAVRDAPGGGGGIACGERRLAVPSDLIPAGAAPLFEYVGLIPDCVDPEPCHPDCWITELDQQSGTSTSSKDPRRFKGVFGGRTYANDGYSLGMERGEAAVYGDSGGASRFFPRFRYQAKASTRERNAGVDGGNHHPTIKPLDLMRWLVRLVTPPGGLVLDPFAGSGTTLMAATLEGFDSVGIEADADYLPALHARVRWAETQQAALPLEAS